MNGWAGQPLPLSATAWEKEHLLVRLSGAESAVETAMKKLGGDLVKHGPEFWLALKEQTLPEFSSNELMWRVSLPSTAPVLASGETLLVEWGGALRWVLGQSAAIREEALRLGGHATLFRSPEVERQQVFTPLSAPMAVLQQRIHVVFDPHGVFDTGRM
jgi:glycolate oxidase FAD binding subunit